jgi:hypothetical protein
MRQLTRYTKGATYVSRSKGSGRTEMNKDLPLPATRTVGQGMSRQRINLPHKTLKGGEESDVMSYNEGDSKREPNHGTTLVTDEGANHPLDPTLHIMQGIDDQHRYGIKSETETEIDYLKEPRAQRLSELQVYQQYKLSPPLFEERIAIHQ